MKQKYQNNRGVTLIETTIALAVLSFGILSLMLLYTSGLRGTVKAQELTVQSNHAAAQIEELMSCGYKDKKLKPLDGDNNLFVGTTPKSRKKLKCPNNKYHCIKGNDLTIFWDIQKNNPIPRTKRVRVYVIPDNDITNETVYEYVKPFHL